ncbi:major capsid protein [Mammaliicoccus sciuri]|uniref:major capsid protein n=1 Tax=Mammaliicoccus sciuri TaxID=1296 RepID=UPI003A927D2F
MVLEDKQLTRATLQAFVDSSSEFQAENMATKYPLAAAFPVEEVEDIRNVYDIVSNQIQAAAVVTGFNSGSPLRSKGQAKQAIASLTKIQNAYFLDEVEILHYRNPRTPEERQKIIDNVLIETNELAVSVDDTKEYLRAQMAYNGKVNYQDALTQSKIEFNLDRPEENDITVSTPWGTEDAQPITDLLAAVKQYQKTNGRKKPEVISMNSTTYEKLIRSGQIKTEIFGDSTSPRIVKEDDVAALLNAFKLPPVSIDDNVTVLENLDGSYEEKEHLQDDRVVLRASILGSTMSGPNVENNHAKGKYVLTVIDEDPHTEKTIVGEVTLPVTKNVTGTVFLDINPTSEPEATEG